MSKCMYQQQDIYIPIFFVKTEKYFRNKNIFKRHKYYLANKSNTSYFSTVCSQHRAGEMDFKVKGPWNTEKYC